MRRNHSVRAIALAASLTAAYLTVACLPGCQDGSAGTAGDEATGQATPEVAQPGRSVIVVLIDTLRADHTSLHGHRLGRQTTPALDALAEQSYVFDRAYSAASWTRPSVASLITGRLPSSHGCEDRDGVLAPDLTTLAEAYGSAGFQTSGVVTNGQILDIYGFDQGYDRYVHVKDSPRNAYVNAKRFIQPALTAIDTLDRSQPYFMYLHLVDPHDPFRHHDDTDFDPAYDGEMSGSREALEPFRWSAPEPDAKQRVIDLYDGEILWMDGQLQRLFAALDDRGVLDDAWLLVTSDHGEGLWDHRIQSHGQEVFEHQVHVPLMLRPPGGLAGRVDLADPISSIDLAPTLLELSGLVPPAGFDGVSWASALTTGALPPARPVVIDEKLNGVHMVGIIDGDTKLILDLEKQGDVFSPIERARVSKARLFDLATNPGEDPDLAIDVRQRGTPEATALHRQLVATLAAAEARADELGAVGPAVESDEQLEALRALGYLGEDAPPEDENDNPTDGPQDG